QHFLKKIGYLATRDPADAFTRIRNIASLPNAKIGELDDAIISAIKRFQYFYRIPVTGMIDGITLQALNRPRCGFPDFVSAADFVLQGNKWNKTSITYRFDSFPPILTNREVRTAIADAFALWSAVIPLDFLEVTSG